MSIKLRVIRTSGANRDQRILFKDKLALFFSIVTLLVCLDENSCAQANMPPNILLLISDDLRPQLGCYGDDVVRTPNIDKFARKALRFDRAYVQCAICSPSRNSFLSGLRPHTTGLRGFGTSIRKAVPDIVTLPQHFKNNGYHTFGIGKIFHLYAESLLGSEDDPQSWSEPVYYPSTPVWGPEQNQLRNRLIAEARSAGKEFRHPHDWPRGETWDAPDVGDDELNDGELTAKAIDFLSSRKENQQPFFLAVGFLKPHLPFVAPQKYWNFYDPSTLKIPLQQSQPAGSPAWVVNQGVVKNYYNMPNPDQRDQAFFQKYLQGYLACISYVDACTGRILCALDEQELSQNTIVLFLGDHGYQMGEYGSWGHKHSNFEISTRTPLLVYAPGMKAGGQASASLVEFLDLFPTLCDLSGLQAPPHLEGKSFAPLLNDPEMSIHDAVFSEMNRQRNIYGRSMRTQRFRYTEWTDSRNNIVLRELYDHQKDSDETRNIASQLQSRHIVHKLATQLNQALKISDSHDEFKSSP